MGKQAPIPTNGASMCAAIFILLEQDFLKLNFEEKFCFDL